MKRLHKGAAGEGEKDFAVPSSPCETPAHAQAERGAMRFSGPVRPGEGKGRREHF